MAVSVIGAEEARELTLGMADVESCLATHMARYGVAIVIGAAGQEELGELQRLLAMDLGDLVVTPAIEIDTSPMKCQGTAASGVACKIAMGKNMGMAFKHTRPLRLGGSFCSLHRTGAPVTGFPGAVPVHRNIPLEAWDEKAVELLGEKGRLHDRGLPNGRFAWASRLLPGVRRCFQSLFPGEELCVGLDMPFFSPATRVKKPAVFPEPHVDRNEHLTSEKCWQAILYVWEAGEKSSTTVVLPKSHVELYPSIMEDRKIPKSHYVELQKLEGKGEFLDAWKIGARRLLVPSGALVLWDSKLVHTGWAGGRRLAQPVCWEPVSRRDDAARLRKISHASQGLSTSHSAAEGRLHTVHGKTPMSVPASRVVLQNETYTLLPTISPVVLCGKRSVQQAWESTTGANETGTFIQAKFAKYL